MSDFLYFLQHVSNPVKREVNVNERLLPILDIRSSNPDISNFIYYVLNL